MSNIGLEIAFAQHGIQLLRTPVGDKYVMEAMLNGGYVLGGEQSGHVILAEHLPTGDGMATALAVLRVMAETGRELADLAAELVTYPQTLTNVRVRDKRDVADVPEIQAAIARVERGAGRSRPGARSLFGHRAVAAHHDRRPRPGVRPGLGGRDRRRRPDHAGLSHRMINLSVNVNKIATLRNSRGGAVPSVSARSRPACRRARPASRCIRERTSVTSAPTDVTDISALDRPPAALRRRSNSTSKAIRDRTSSISCSSARPDQCTLVPVIAWRGDESGGLAGRRRRPISWPASFGSSRPRAIRVSLFVDPQEAPVRWAARLGADRIELYTEPFARAFAPARRRAGRRSRATCRRRAGALARPRRERRARSRSRESVPVSDPSAFGRSVDRPCADQSRDLGRP